MSLVEELLDKGHSARLSGRFSSAEDFYREALESTEDRLEHADALVGLAMSVRGACRFSKALLLFDEAIGIYDSRKDVEGRAFALYGRGGTRRLLGDFVSGLNDLEEAFVLAPDETARAFTLMALGGLKRMIGEYEESLDLYGEALEIAQELGEIYPEAYAECGVGNALRMMGSPETRNHLERADRLYREIDDRVSRPYTLLALGLLDLQEEKPVDVAEAGRLFEETADLRGTIHWQLVCAAAFPEKTELIGAAAELSRDLGLKLEYAHARFLEGSADAERLYEDLGAKIPSAPYLLP